MKVIDKIFNKSIGCKLIDYMNMFLKIIGIDINNLTSSLITTTIIICSILFIIKILRIVYRYFFKKKKKEYTIKTIKTIKTEFPTIYDTSSIDYYN